MNCLTLFFIFQAIFFLFRCLIVFFGYHKIQNVLCDLNGLIDFLLFQAIKLVQLACLLVWPWNKGCLAVQLTLEGDLFNFFIPPSKGYTPTETTTFQGCFLSEWGQRPPKAHLKNPPYLLPSFLHSHPRGPFLGTVPINDAEMDYPTGKGILLLQKGWEGVQLQYPCHLPLPTLKK